MSEQSDAIISLKNITHKYKTRTGIFKTFEHTALSDISFELMNGETLGILGRNGCGKSSLLKIIAGIVNPTKGKVLCKGDIKRSLLTLGLGFRPDLSGKDNAIISAMLLGYSKQDAIDALPEIKGFSELGEFFEQPVKTYSSGMRARLGFSSALMTKVDVLLIDEVLSVGDARFRKKAENAMIKHINGSQSIVFVSHNPKQIENICDRAIWIESGTIHAEGAAKDVSMIYDDFMNSVET